MAQRRRATTTAVVCLSLLLSVAPGAGAHHTGELRDKIAETQRKADAARSELSDLADDIETTEAAADDAATRLAYAEADLAAITAKLNARQRDLAEVEGQLVEAEEHLAEATAAHELALATAAREEDRAVRSARLVDQEQVELDRQVAAIYKYGRSTEVTRWLVAVRSAQTVSDFGHTKRLLSDASDEQTRILDRMTRLREKAERNAAAAQAARVSAELRAEEAADLKAQVETLVAAQEDLVASAERLVAAQRGAVATVEAERAALEAEAAQLTVTKERTASELKELEAAEAKLEKELQALLAKPTVSGPAPGMLQFPTAGRVGSRFGYRIHPIYGYARLHAGVDIGAPTGQKIVSAAAGKVVRSGWCGGYGNCVVVDHGGGMATLYAHMSRRSVGVGTRVSMGQTVGLIGSTGLSTGPHLHFEVRVNGTPKDPCRYLSEC